MKKILLALIGLLTLSSSFMVKAQDFSIADTIRFTVSTTGNFNDPITNNLTKGLSITWRIVGTNFPADWLSGSALGICDNYICRYNIDDTLWSGLAGSPFTSNPYLPGSGGTFEYSPNLTSATSPSDTGTYFLTVKLSDSTSYNRTTTFIITKPPLSVPNVPNFSNDVVLYPNPANDEINVVYNPNADIKNIAVYNIIGKVLSVYKVTGSSANLTLENVPSGIYFVRLYNSVGNVVATKKFTKQ